jgi:two-component system NtrC family sensor kinase
MKNEDTRILFVDDERNVLHSLERLFIDDGYDIHTAGSGAEALELLEQSGDFKLVVSDYRMPGMNGVEFLAEVCRRWPETERIILSGYADTGAIVSAINEGQIYKFIAKPWNDDDLFRVVREALDRYELREKNRILVRELGEANRELEIINKNLHVLVGERVREVMLQNHLLSGIQNILDALPLGFIGSDGNGMIVQCNVIGARMLAVSRNELIGADAGNVLPPELAEIFDQLNRTSRVERQITLTGRAVRVIGSRIRVDEQDALVITLMEAP